MNVGQAINTFRGHRVPHLKIIEHRNWWFALSGVFIVLSIAGLAIRGLNFSIEFKGGSLLQFPNRTGASIAEYQTVLGRFGLSDAEVEVVGGTGCPASGCVDIKTRSLTELGFNQAPPSPTPSATVAPTPTAAASATPTPTPSATSTSEATPTPSASAATPSPSASASPAVTGTLPTPKGDLLRGGLARVAGITTNDINEQDVGPTWGATISNKALTGLIVFLILVSIYISLRFEPKMAASALIALLHDLIITAGIYALVGREVTPETVIAILTILGYSLYDTVVIFDKIKENTESMALVAREGYSGVVDISLNQTLMRSVNTSLVVLLPIGALLLFGGQTLKDFAFALFIGVASGTYSSIFIASPALAILKEREPRFQQMKARAESRAARPALRSATSRRQAGDDGRELETVATGAPATQAGAAAPASGTPRPRPASSGGQPRKKKPKSGQRKPRRR
jgi:preprotein translocase subunit SecF